MSSPLRHGNRLEYAIYRVATGALASLPRGTAIRTGAALGLLAARLLRRQRQVALFNLALAFPEKSDDERLDILRRSCRNLGRMGAEFCHMGSLDRDCVERYVGFDDRGAWEHAMALARERGAVILTAHFGNWELFHSAQALLGRPVTLVHRPMNNPLVDDAIRAARDRAGTRSLAKKAAARDVVRALRDRAMVVIPADQNQRRDYGVFVDFFGKPACTTPGPARLAMLTGAPVIPAFLVREGETDRHRIVVLPEVEMQRGGDRDADIVANTQRCTKVIEDMIRRHPDHWIWFHRRWKTRPRGEPRLYPRG